MKYINEKRKKRASTKEVRSILEKSVGVKFAGSSDIRDCIISVIFICGYITAADLSYYLGMPENSFKSLHRQLNDLVNAKLLCQINFDAKDGMSRTCYYLSEAGFSYGSALMDRAFFFRYKRRGKALTTLHDYSSGLNALQLILNGEAFSWSREVVYSSASTIKKHQGSLCIDGIADFDDYPGRLYFEEDLGNETVYTLYNKLSKYERFNLLKDADASALIFSFRKPYVVCDSPSYLAFSPKNIDLLISFMEKENMGVNEAFSALPEDSELRDVITNLKDVLGISGTGLNISIEGLRNFNKDLEELKLDCRVGVLNRIQDEFTKQRAKGILGYILKDFSIKDGLRSSYIDSLLRGFRIYCLPTPLIANYMRFIHFDAKSMPEKINVAINGKMTPCGPYKHSVTFNAGNGLWLRNYFTDGSRHMIIEDVFRDLGGYLRVWAYIDYVENGLIPDTDLTLVCLCCLDETGRSYELNELSNRISNHNKLHISQIKLVNIDKL